MRKLLALAALLVVPGAIPLFLAGGAVTVVVFVYRRLTTKNAVVQVPRGTALRVVDGGRDAR